MTTRLLRSTGKWTMIALLVLAGLWYLFAKTTFLAHLVPTKYETLAVFPATDALPAVEVIQNKSDGKCYYYADVSETEAVVEEVPCPI